MTHGRSWALAMRAPVGLLGMLLLVGMIERQVGRNELHFTLAEAENWKFSERQARRQTTPGSILCFGTSLVKDGLLPRIIESRTGRTSYNLAAMGGHMPTSYYLLKRSLESGARPSAILVDCQDGPVPIADAAKPADAIRLNLRNWPGVLTLLEVGEFSWRARNASLLTDYVVSGLLPSAKMRHEIRTSIQACLRNEEASSLKLMVATYGNWTANRGTFVLPPKGTDDEEATSIPPSPLPRDQFLPNALSQTYTRRFLELAAAHQIRVFWLLPPVSSHAQRERDGAGLSAYFTSRAALIQREYPWVTVIDSRRAAYPARAFHDKVHLNRLGAVAYTSAIAEVVEQAMKRPGDSRWISAPEYQAAPERIAVEDINESLSRPRRF
jgi:hypothetical protein